MAVILVVDDHLPLLNVLTRTLVLEGHDVLAAPNGYEAIWACETEHVDLIICDLLMPRQTGIDVIQRCGPRPAILMSGHDEAEVRAIVQIPEGVMLLRKPFTVDELLHAVDSSLQQADMNAKK